MNISESIQEQHYAFKVDDSDFNRIFKTIKSKNIPYSSEPLAAIERKFDQRVNHELSLRRIYFLDPSGHLLEIQTDNYDINS